MPNAGEGGIGTRQPVRASRRDRRRFGRDRTWSHRRARGTSGRPRQQCGHCTAAEVSGPIALNVFDTNAIGLIRVTQAALPLLEQSENPVVVNVSSALGSFWAVTNPDRRQFHFPSIIYGSSKAAVSMLTVQYAKSIPGIKFNAVEPGFTATDLTPFSGADNRLRRAQRSLYAWPPSGRMAPPAPSRKANENSPGEAA